MTTERFLAIIGMALTVLFVASGSAWAQAYSYVANTQPPDAFLALKMYPSSNSPRITAMANGTKLDVLLRRIDGWWYVRVWPTGEEGWAFSGRGNKAWILCCATLDGSQTEAQPVAKEITDFSCGQLWFARNSIFKEAGYCFKTPRAISAFGNAGCLYDDVNAVGLSPEKYSSGVGRLVELQVSGEDLALRLALRSVDAGRGSGRG